MNTLEWCEDIIICDNLKTCIGNNIAIIKVMYFIIPYDLNSWEILCYLLNGFHVQMVTVYMCYKQIFNIIKFIFYLSKRNTHIHHYIINDHTISFGTC